MKSYLENFDNVVPIVPATIDEKDDTAEESTEALDDESSSDIKDVIIDRENAANSDVEQEGAGVDEDEVDDQPRPSRKECRADGKDYICEYYFEDYRE